MHVLEKLRKNCGFEINKEKLNLMLIIKVNNTFLHIYTAYQNIDIKNLILQKDEVQSVKLVSKQQIFNMIKENEFSTTVSNYFNLLIKCIENDWEV